MLNFDFIECSILNEAGASPVLAQPGPTGMSAFAPLLGDKRTSILLHLTASVCSASRSPREPDPACRRNLPDPGVVLIRT